MPATTVRIATLNDLDALVAMRVALLHEEARSPLFAGAAADAPTQVRHITHRQLTATGQAFFIALADDATPLGMLRCGLHGPSALLDGGPHAMLTTAYVIPSGRRLGVLRSLVEAAEAWAHRRGVSDVRLRCTTENAEGNAAWAALGYSVVAYTRRRVLPD